jgi:hypothetical protein
MLEIFELLHMLRPNMLQFILWNRKYVHISLVEIMFQPSQIYNILEHGFFKDVNYLFGYKFLLLMFILL